MNLPAEPRRLVICMNFHEERRLLSEGDIDNQGEPAVPREMRSDNESYIREAYLSRNTGFGGTSRTGDRMHKLQPRILLKAWYTPWAYGPFGLFELLEVSGTPSTFLVFEI